MANEAAEPDAAPVSEMEKARHVFMTKVTQYEELVDMGKRFLVKFHQELDHFWRPKLQTESGAVGELLKSNYTERMKSYFDAGCTLHHQNIRNMNQLHSCEEKLLEHVQKAKALLQELQYMVDDIYSFIQKASLCSLRASEDCHGNDNLTNVCSQDVQQPGDQVDSAVSLVSVMVLVNNMLEFDYSMQENIVKALCLKTSSSEMEGYCLMWDLRPYIDDNMMQLAWNLLPRSLQHVMILKL